MSLNPYAIFLRAVEIDSDNDTIIIDENGSDRTATIPHGVYWARGDGDATDLIAAIATAFTDAMVGSNAFQMGWWRDGSQNPSWDIDAANPSATCRLELQSGTTPFRVKWSDAGTTFPKALLGFSATKASADTNAESSTLSPTSVWVPNDLVRIVVPRLIAAGAEETEGADGSVDVVARSASSERRRIELRLLDARRVFAHENEDDPAATIARFWDVARGGDPIEIHTQELDGSTTYLLGIQLGDTDMTRDATASTRWLFVSPTTAGIEPVPVMDGLNSWDLDLHIAGYVEP